MESAQPWADQEVDLSSDESDSSDMDVMVEDGYSNKLLDNNAILFRNCFNDITSEGALMKRAEMYQDYMKQIRIPANRGSLIPNVTWVGLGKSIKKLYGQPLHYLTNLILKQWDQMRFGTRDEDLPLDSIVHPSKAEATIWMIEEVHRQTSSHIHIAKLWECDAMYHMNIDPIFPN